MALFSSYSPIHLILLLRAVAIVGQVALLVFVNTVLAYQITVLPIAVIISAEVVFTSLSYWLVSKRAQVGNKSIFMQILADILFLTLLLYFSGGATNAFVSLLLVPLAIAAVTLPLGMLTWLALSAVAGYSALLWLMPMDLPHGSMNADLHGSMHENMHGAVNDTVQVSMQASMQGHFVAMWVNFLLSAAVVVIVVSKLARGLQKRELAIAAYREEQLKQERIVALGVASAQITHELATPLATVQLLAEELLEQSPNNQLIADMQHELTRCNQSIGHFRDMVFKIKEQQAERYLIAQLIDEIAQYLCLQHPEISFNQLQFKQQKFKQQEFTKQSGQPTPKNQDNQISIIADASLLPAIYNLINNAVRASKQNAQNRIELASQFAQSTEHETVWQLTIRDFGQGFEADKLAELGSAPVTNAQGLGVAVLLSHASLERIGGKLTLTNHKQGGALVSLFLPVKADEAGKA